MITKLKPNEIFVFGSNSQGHHGRGAALIAYKQFGAKYGKGAGIQGQSFAIPTCYWRGNKLMPSYLEDIKAYVDLSLIVFKANPENTYLVTRIGCGLARYKDEQIAPMFKDAPPNCIFSPKWKPFLPDNFKFDDRLY